MEENSPLLAGMLHPNPLLKIRVIKFFFLQSFRQFSQAQQAVQLVQQAGQQLDGQGVVADLLQEVIQFLRCEVAGKMVAE